jgi:uncharacterized damage-inducible protein DinB
MSATLSELFKHNTWANLRLIDACVSVSEEHLDATAPGTFGSIRDTLVHLVAAQERYLSAFTGQRPENPLRESDGFPGFPELRERALLTGEGLMTRASRADANPTVETTWHGEPVSLPASLFFLQAINHATEHRAQAATVLTAVGIEPPGMDGWAYNDDQATR